MDYSSKILVSEPEDTEARHHQGDGKSHPQRRFGTPAAVCPFSPCPLCNVTELNKSLPTHVINEHTNSNESWDTLFNLNFSLYSYILCFIIFLNLTLSSIYTLPFSITCSLPFCQCPGGPVTTDLDPPKLGLDPLVQIFSKYGPPGTNFIEISGPLLTFLDPHWVQIFHLKNTFLLCK